MAVGGWELFLSKENRIYLSPEQHYAWGGWYWVWPYALSAPVGWALFRSPLAWMAAWLCWKGARRALGKTKPA